MDILRQYIQSKGIKFIAFDGENEIGHVYLYLIYNDLHSEPAGYLENMFVDEVYRGSKVGSALLDAVLVEARRLRCYKIVSTSRESRQHVHEWYERTGFEKYGFAFRMNLDYE